MDRQDHPVSNFIPKHLLEIICILENDETRHSCVLIRNLGSLSFVTKTPANNENLMPLKTNVYSQPSVNLQNKMTSWEKEQTEKRNLLQKVEGIGHEERLSGKR